MSDVEQVMPDFVRERVEHMADRMRMTGGTPADLVILLLADDSVAARGIAGDLGQEPGWWDRKAPGGMILIPALASRAWITAILAGCTDGLADALRAIPGLAVVAFAADEVLVHEYPWVPA